MPTTWAEVPPLANFRDLGGHPVAGGGRVRRGLVYRSTDLSRLDDAGVAAVGRLPIRTVYDLRTQVERRAHPDRVPPGTRHVVVDVLEDGVAMGPSALMALLQDPAAAEAVLGEGGAIRIFEAKYREFVTLDSARRGYGRLFMDLADPDNHPGLFHCTTGKDRTGWAAAALLLVLGVPEPVVMDDFLQSTDQLLRAFEPEFEAFRVKGGNPQLLHPLIGVRPEYLAASLTTMRDRFGTVEGYFAEGLGVGAAVQRALRDAFVERA